MSFFVDVCTAPNNELWLHEEMNVSFSRKRCTNVPLMTRAGRIKLSLEGPLFICHAAGAGGDPLLVLFYSSDDVAFLWFFNHMEKVNSGPFSIMFLIRLDNSFVKWIKANGHLRDIQEKKKAYIKCYKISKITSLKKIKKGLTFI